MLNFYKPTLIPRSILSYVNFKFTLWAHSKWFWRVFAITSFMYVHHSEVRNRNDKIQNRFTVLCTKFIRKDKVRSRLFNLLHAKHSYVSFVEKKSNTLLIRSKTPRVSHTRVLHTFLPDDKSRQYYTESPLVGGEHVNYIFLTSATREC